MGRTGPSVGQPIRLAQWPVQQPPATLPCLPAPHYSFAAWTRALWNVSVGAFVTRSRQ